VRPVTSPTDRRSRPFLSIWLRVPLRLAPGRVPLVFGIRTSNFGSLCCDLVSKFALGARGWRPWLGSQVRGPTLETTL
jgi:hypothetical protein